MNDNQLTWKQASNLTFSWKTGDLGGLGGVIMCAHVQVGRIKCPQPVIATLKVHLQNS